MRTNNGASRRQMLLNLYRVFTTLALTAAVVLVSIQLNRPAPSTAEIAQAVNGPVKFERPSTLEYVAKTNSCVVGGVVTSTEWHVGNKTVSVFDVDSSAVNYTVFGFKSDEGRVFTVSTNGALYTEPGQNLGLELHCDPATVDKASSFEMIAIIYGGK